MATTNMTSPTLDSTPVPAAGRYTFDPAHTYVGFSVRHLMMAHIKGRFTSLSGAVVIADDPLESSVNVSMDTASVDTRDEQRDGHLRSPDFFHVEAYPVMTFTSTNLRASGTDFFEIDGVLTIKDVSLPVTLFAKLEGIGLDPWGNERVGFSAHTEIRRDDWGLTWNQPLETGGVFVGKTVQIEIEAEIVRSPA